MKPLVLEGEDHSNEDVIVTGRAELDKRLGGGIPVGSLTLIEGQSDAGKSVLAQQLIWGSLNNGHTVMLFTTENTVKSFHKQMESLGLSVIDHLLLGNLRIFHVQISKMGKASSIPTILSAIERYQSCNLIVIDSLTPVIAHTNVENVITYFEECKRLCDKGRTIINIAHTYAFNEEVLIRLRSVCDAHFRLRIEEIGDNLVKMLEVSKVRGADKTTGNILSFEVEPGLGMKVMPISRAQA